MRHFFGIRQVLLLVVGLGVASAGAEIPMQVSGSRVNMRARPGTRYEVVGQLSHRQAVVAKSIRDEWVELAPPPGSMVWLHQDFVSENRVTAETLNARAGPGINYSVVGRLPRDTVVVPREQFGEWIKMDAPEMCSFWVHTDYVEAIRPDPPPAPPPEPEPEPEPEPVPVPGPVPDPELQPEPEPPPPDDSAALQGLTLIPLAGQGKAVSVEGLLRRTEFLLGRPSKYRLVPDGRQADTTLFYIRGNEDQLETLLGQSMRIQGREYWAQKVTTPIVVPAKIILRRPR